MIEAAYFLTGCMFTAMTFLLARYIEKEIQYRKERKRKGAELMEFLAWQRSLYEVGSETITSNKAD